MVFHLKRCLLHSIFSIWMDKNSRIDSRMLTIEISNCICGKARKPNLSCCEINWTNSLWVSYESRSKLGFHEIIQMKVLVSKDALRGADTLYIVCRHSYLIRLLKEEVVNEVTHQVVDEVRHLIVFESVYKTHPVRKT